jgi:hypothetical protein
MVTARSGWSEGFSRFDHLPDSDVEDALIG